MTRTARTRWPRLALTAAVLGGALAGVPAVAALLAPRALPPAQLSLNVDRPLFDVSNLVPGDVAIRCVRVRNEGTAPVRIDGVLAINGPLAEHLLAVVYRGSGLGDRGPSCAGFTASGGFAFGTRAGGVPVADLRPDAEPSVAPGTERSYLIAVIVPAGAPDAAQGRTATAGIGWWGTSLAAGDAPGGGGRDGQLLSDAQVKRRFHMGRARVLRNGDVVVPLVIPRGGAIRAKVVLRGQGLYGHRLYRVVHAGRFTVVIRRRALGRAAVAHAHRSRRTLRALVTIRYRWAHGPTAYIEPRQRVALVRRR